VLINAGASIKKGILEIDALPIDDAGEVVSEAEREEDNGDKSEG